jgi:predicted RNA binding protein YcfA (HicA-like mRNA interferase family)
LFRFSPRADKSSRAMSKYEKVWQRIASGRSDRNIDFDDLVWLLEYKGFKKRHRGGSHVIFTKPGVRERITLQPEGSKAKGYQVRQVRAILMKEQ